MKNYFSLVVKILSSGFFTRSDRKQSAQLHFCFVPYSKSRFSGNWAHIILYYRDISFLYDVPNPDTSASRPEKIDKSTVRQDASEPKKQVSD